MRRKSVLIQGSLGKKNLHEVLKYGGGSNEAKAYINGCRASTMFTQGFKRGFGYTQGLSNLIEVSLRGKHEPSTSILSCE